MNKKLAVKPDFMFFLLDFLNQNTSKFLYSGYQRSAVKQSPQPQYGELRQELGVR